MPEPFPTNKKLVVPPSAETGGTQSNPDHTIQIPVTGDSSAVSGTDKASGAQATGQREVGGPAGPEPTRYGDWEHKGRCIDF